jgi:hypothetical protein
VQHQNSKTFGEGLPAPWSRHVMKQKHSSVPKNITKSTGFRREYLLLNTLHPSDISIRIDLSISNDMLS